MNKDSVTIDQFKKAIDALTISDYFFRGPYSFIFKSQYRTFKMERNDGLFFSRPQAILEGDSAFSNVYIDISINTYNEIDEYLQQKLMSFQYTVFKNNSTVV